MRSLNFERDKATIKLCGFDLHTNNNYYCLSITVESEELAYYLQDDWTSRCHRALLKARRDAYEQGYKDAKAKRKKQDWFYNSLEIE
jgi:hypothetical protein